VVLRRDRYLLFGTLQMIVLREVWCSVVQRAVGVLRDGNCDGCCDWATSTTVGGQQAVR
jgi:hypothetical protein